MVVTAFETVGFVRFQRGFRVLLVSFVHFGSLVRAFRMARMSRLDALGLPRQNVSSDATWFKKVHTYSSWSLHREIPEWQDALSRYGSAQYATRVCHLDSIKRWRRSLSVLRASPLCSGALSLLLITMNLRYPWLCPSGFSTTAGPVCLIVLLRGQAVYCVCQWRRKRHYIVAINHC